MPPTPKSASSAARGWPRIGNCVSDLPSSSERRPDAARPPAWGAPGASGGWGRRPLGSQQALPFEFFLEPASCVRTFFVEHGRFADRGTNRLVDSFIERAVPPFRPEVHPPARWKIDFDALLVGV